MNKRFTLNNFIKFLEKQPADGVYRYADQEYCAASQFSREINRSYSVPSREGKGEASKIERAAFVGEEFRDKPRTYGGALATARKIKEHA